MENVSINFPFERTFLQDRVLINGNSFVSVLAE